ncbi:MAG: hypothetical protein COS08_07715 [Euryarchaeota archaeon CG01_land_8_20_14_3_00_38_12]|nr:MAG: hypothetical protein COS08_07715 [Euryarchaeota archaeon CG01_land_8_20_14_3_00_38_12]PJB21519.1 MAG: hypothetical protein CO114_04925 [Euryarchaeota archaeon CG_4_9_14_3_um_filter_38_12]
MKERLGSLYLSETAFFPFITPSQHQKNKKIFLWALRLFYNLICPIFQNLTSFYILKIETRIF